MRPKRLLAGVIAATAATLVGTAAGAASSAYPSFETTWSSE